MTDSGKKTSRRGIIGGVGMGAAGLMAMGVPVPGMAAEGEWGPARKLVWVPQALGDWDTAMQVGFRDFCGMVGWSYQRIGNPNYSVENHVEQVNNAIASGPDVIVTELESEGLVASFERGAEAGITMVITDQGIEAEAQSLGLHIIGQDELPGRHHQRHGRGPLRPEADGQEGGRHRAGNGNPGSISIDKRQNGSEQGSRTTTRRTARTITFEAFPDS